MNELLELERELGPQLRQALNAIIPTNLSHFADAPSMEIVRHSREDAAAVAIEIRDHPARTTERRHRLIGVAAIIIAVAGLGGIVTLGPRDRSTTKSGSPEPTQSTGSVGVTTVPLPDPENPPGIYLPTAPLPGFSLAGITIDRGRRAANQPNTSRYVRRAVNGVDVAAMITLTAAPSVTGGSEPSDERTPPLLVHGQPAHIGDTGEGIVASWDENGVAASVRGWGLSSDDVVSLAEQTLVDSSTDAITLPAEALQGYEPSIGDTYPPADAVTTNLHYLADDHRPGAFVDVANYSSDDLTTLDSVEVISRMAFNTIDRTVVHNLPAIVATSPAGQFGSLISVSWIEDGYQFVVGGRADKADLIAFANHLALASLEQARQLRASLDTTLFALTELDRATLPNGFDVSIRTAGTGTDVICLHSPIQRCQLVSSEASLGGETQHEITDTFWINGTAWFIGWAEGKHSPQPIVHNEPADPAMLSVTQGATGTFIALPLTDEFTQIKFDAGDQTLYGGNTQTKTDLLS